MVNATLIVVKRIAPLFLLSSLHVRKFRPNGWNAILSNNTFVTSTGKTVRAYDQKLDKIRHNIWEIRETCMKAIKPLQGTQTFSRLMLVTNA